MALVCGEHGDHDILVGDKIFGALLPDGSNAAFCERTLDAIPKNVRSKGKLAGGVDIHTGSSKVNMGGLSRSYSWSDLTYGSRLFSISRENLACYLPGVTRLLFG